MREVVHEAHVERDVVTGNVLEQREHVFAGGGRQEVVGVLDALSDAFEALEVAQRIVLEKTTGIRIRDRCEYRDIRTP
jgi:hypothetical protein